MKSLGGNPADWFRFVIRHFSARCVKRICCIRGLRLAIIGPTLLPKPERDWKRINVDLAPPRGLVTLAMKLAVVDPTNRHGELIADSVSKGTRLHKRQVMRIRRRPAAYKARLPGHELPVLLIAQANRFA